MLPPQTRGAVFQQMTVGGPASGARRLPAWGVFFISLGAVAGSVRDDIPPLTVALSVPTRTFAAVLTSLGVVHQRCGLAPEGHAHFENLWRGELGVTVRLRQGSMEQRGSLRSKEVRAGVRYLCVATSRTGTFLVPETMAGSIISVGAAHKRPQRTRNLTVEDPWLARVLEGCDYGSYLFYDRHDCLLVGYDSGLQEEASLALSFLENSGHSLSGQIAKLLRVRSWQATSKTYSAEVLSHATQVHDADLEHLRRFKVVVFDGAGPFIKWHGLLAGQHHVVLLDRTEARHLEGTSAVNIAALDRDGDFLSLPLEVPPGIEATAFLRRA